MAEESQEELNKALEESIKNNNPKKLISLLEAGAHIEYRYNDCKWTPLIHAAYKKHIDVITVLLNAGADIHAEDNEGDSFVGYMESRPEVKKTYNYFLNESSVDSIIFRHSLNDRVLEEIYNFETLERISLVRKGEFDSVEAMFRESFFKIDNKKALREAFNEHVKRGGKTDENNIFPNIIVKPKQNLS